MEIYAFFCGALFSYTKNAYVFCGLAILLYFRAKINYIVYFSAAMLLASLHQWYVTDSNMPAISLFAKAKLTGQVVSIPMIQGTRAQFEFQVDHLNAKPVSAKVLCTCYDHCPSLRVGQSWSFTAKLKRPREMSNPGGFDYKSWLAIRHMHWTATITRNSFHPLAPPKNVFFLSKIILQWRSYLAKTQEKHDKNVKALGVIQALTLGLTNHISKESWDLFRRTGTTHLMVISGSHIALVSGFAYAFTKFIWARLGSLCLYYPAPKVAGLVALLMSFFYTVLAGFGVPAQRSLIACFFAYIRFFSYRRFNVWQGWRYALLGVILYEPHAVLTPGFYLSFLATGILLLCNERIQVKGWKKAWLIQLLCLIGLMPLTLFWFSYGAINGFIANLVAIPFVGFLLVPLSLLMTCVGDSGLSSLLGQILNPLVRFLLYYLQWVDHLNVINLTFPFIHILQPLSLMAAIAMLWLFPERSLFAILFVLLLVSFFSPQERIKPNDAIIDVLDVGQGLAVVVRTHEHTLIYDTGGKFYGGSDMGKLVIIPYLQHEGIRHIDKVVISHPDLDHRGGLASIESRYPISELIVDNPSFYKRGVSCHDYPEWSWDGVHFRFFPIRFPDNRSSKNNRSCVLQISTAKAQLLLTGDIEKPAEHYLERTYKKALHSSIMVIPHHGSKTSSTPAFIKKVNPKYAIMSLGFDNRYHFPHAQAMNTYQKAHIPIYNTIDCGMIRLSLTAKQTQQAPRCFIE